MAELEQMLRRELAAALVVADHPAHAAGKFSAPAGYASSSTVGMRLARSISSVASRCCQRTAGTSSSASTWRAISFCTSRISFSAPVEGMSEQNLQVRATSRLPFDAPDQMRIVGMIDLRHDDADETAAAQAQILRRAIRNVMTPLRLGLDARLAWPALMSGASRSAFETAIGERFNDVAISFSVDIERVYLLLRQLSS